VIILKKNNIGGHVETSVRGHKGFYFQLLPLAGKTAHLASFSPSSSSSFVFFVPFVVELFLRSYLWDKFSSVARRSPITPPVCHKCAAALAGAVGAAPFLKLVSNFTFKEI
jgi:hypothetical protein